jgi:hypothetical protein
MATPLGPISAANDDVCDCCDRIAGIVMPTSISEIKATIRDLFNDTTRLNCPLKKDLLVEFGSFRFVEIIVVKIFLI